MPTPGTGLPKLSSASTATFKAAPATAFFGWVVNNSCDVLAGEMVKEPETMLCRPGRRGRQGIGAALVMDSVTNDAGPVVPALTDVVPFKVQISEVLKTSEITASSVLGTASRCS